MCGYRVHVSLYLRRPLPSHHGELFCRQRNVSIRSPPPRGAVKPRCPAQPTIRCASSPLARSDSGEAGLPDYLLSFSMSSRPPSRVVFVGNIPYGKLSCPRPSSIRIASESERQLLIVSQVYPRNKSPTSSPAPVRSSASASSTTPRRAAPRALALPTTLTPVRGLCSGTSRTMLTLGGRLGLVCCAQPQRL